MQQRFETKRSSQILAINLHLSFQYTLWGYIYIHLIFSHLIVVND